MPRRLKRFTHLRRVSSFLLGCRILEESRWRGGDRVKRYGKLYVVSTLKTETGLKSILDHRAKVTRVFDDECVRLFTRKRGRKSGRGEIGLFVS